MKKVGETFCSFFMERLREHFKKIPEDLYLEFCTEEGITPLEIVGEKKDWADSRLESSSGTISGMWGFWSGSRIENSSLELFLMMIIEELEKRFPDLLYVESVEEHALKYIKDTKIQWKEILSDSLISFFVGDLLSREWLITQYIRRVIKSRKLPPLDLLIQISAQKYERRTVQTSLYFIDAIPDKNKNNLILEGTDSEEIEIKEMEIKPGNLRTIRKMMEMSGKDCGLLVYLHPDKGYYIVGAVYEKPIDIQAVEVQFTEHLSWRIIEKEEILFECSEGKYRIPVLDGDEINDEWRAILKNSTEGCPEFTDKKIGYIEKIISQFKLQIHGTSIVFMEDNLLVAEVERLSRYKKAYRVKPFPVIENKKRIWGISAIDGAVVVDIEGQCHLTGAIFDGESIVQGDPGRGARFNSINNYVNWVCDHYQNDKIYKEKCKNSWCLAVILSEDKSVNLIFKKVKDRIF